MIKKLYNRFLFWKAMKIYKRAKACVLEAWYHDFSTDRFYHIAQVKDGNIEKRYLDGSLIWIGLI